MGSAFIPYLRYGRHTQPQTQLQANFLKLRSSPLDNAMLLFTMILKSVMEHQIVSGTSV